MKVFKKTKKNTMKKRKIQKTKSRKNKKIKRKQYIKIKGGNGDKVNCCVCGKKTNINDTLIPGSCSRIYGSKAHRICQECWWDPEHGFARETSTHACPGCKKRLPLTKIPTKPTTKKHDVFEISDSDDEK